MCSNYFEILATDEGFNGKMDSDQVYITKDADNCTKANAQKPPVTKFKRKVQGKKKHVKEQN